MSAEPQVFEVLSPIPALDAFPGDLVVVRPWDPMPLSVVRFLGPSALNDLYAQRSHLKRLQPGETPAPPTPPSPRGVLELVR
jgi:hypothetical protein